MSKYADIVKQDTPRIVIKFKFDDEGKDQYEWGNVGTIPVMAMIGAIVKTQIELVSIETDRLGLYNKLCPEQMLVIAWDRDNNTFHWFMHKDTPKYGILGMLDLIRATLVDSIRMRQAAQQPTILDPTGQPIIRR